MTRKTKKDLSQSFHQLFDALAQKREFIARVAFAQLSDADKARADSILTFKKAAFTRAVELGPTVWKNWDFVKDVFVWSPVEPADTIDAALSHPPARIWASGRSLLQRAPRYTLLLSYRAMRYQVDALDKILLHELVHMGYSGHGADFRKVCVEVGGVISGSGVRDPGVHIEKKIGARYMQVHSIKEQGPVAERTARQWIFDEQRAMEARGEPRTSWRLSFG